MLRDEYIAYNADQRALQGAGHIFFTHAGEELWDIFSIIQQNESFPSVSPPNIYKSRYRANMWALNPENIP